MHLMNKTSKLLASLKTERSYFRSDRRWLSMKARTVSYMKRRLVRMERRVNRALCVEVA
jgi:hypothetical protein